jgi:hypothetical protein
VVGDEAHRRIVAQRAAESGDSLEFSIVLDAGDDRHADPKSAGERLAPGADRSQNACIVHPCPATVHPCVGQLEVGKDEIYVLRDLVDY